MEAKKIVLIDGSSLAFRAFYSITDIEKFKNASGLHTNALYSFKLMMDSILQQFEPTHILVAFDKPGGTFRNDLFESYKGNRQKMPTEFKEQLPYLRVLLDGMGIVHYEMAGYEADDIIATMAQKAEKCDSVTIVSGDKDLIQLASDITSVYLTKRGISELEIYTPETIYDKYQLKPDQIIDLKGLMGDASDNYPGVTRVGEKTALKLLHQFSSIESLYERIDELKPSKMKENLINDRQQAFLSKQLAKIITDAPIELDVASIEKKVADEAALQALYQQMNFKSFLSNGIDETPEVTLDTYHSTWEVIEVERITKEILPKKTAILFEILHDNYHFEDIVCAAWADIELQKVFVTSPKIAFSSELFTEWLQDTAIEKISMDLKKDTILAKRYNAQLKHVTFDVSIAAYLLDPNLSHALDQIQNWVGLPQTLLSDEEIYGKASKIAVPKDKEQLYAHLALKLETMIAIVPLLKEKLIEVEAMTLYETIEMPLAHVLTEMEMLGIKVDAAELEQMNDTLIERLNQLEEAIYIHAGEVFNLNSPKQLGEILFEKLGLPIIKKTKTGYSTAADVLEKLKNEHPIMPLILDYRQISKLQGTYLVGLPKYIQSDGKIHTRYVQTLTQTGRLSSTDPNLQNIPIRLEEGRKIRKAFIPSHPDWELFGADYSQIELRVLAHICQDEHLQEAFLKDEDIHAATARRVFGLDASQEVSSDYRRQAKAVNFGIVYGISDYGLSQNLNIPRKEAKVFIERYFEKYPGVADFMTTIVEQARQQGYVSTLFNRRRYLPDITSSNFNIRSFAERTAMNSPIQGTAADVIKIAMIQLQQELKERKMQARLLLQVHDELILEAPKGEIDCLMELVPRVMESAVTLSVPLKVDFHSGKNWYELK